MTRSPNRRKHDNENSQNMMLKLNTNINNNEILVSGERGEKLYPEENLLQRSREAANLCGFKPGSHRWKARELITTSFPRASPLPFPWSARGEIISSLAPGEGKRRGPGNEVELITVSTQCSITPLWCFVVFFL